MDLVHFQDQNAGGKRTFRYKYDNLTLRKALHLSPGWLGSYAGYTGCLKFARKRDRQIERLREGEGEGWVWGEKKGPREEREKKNKGWL